jgi:hypothetical protein
MAYLTLAELKRYLGMEVGEGSSGTGDDGATDTDDVLLTELLEAAEAQIDRYTGRTFAADADATRVYVAGEDTDGRTLYLDRDLCKITSITVAGEALAADTYTTEPRNDKPYHAIIRRGGAWSGEIAVTGGWAWSLTPPKDVVMACRRLAAYRYRQKDAQVFDVSAQVATGSVTIRHEMPRDVRDLLDPYVRRV